MAKDSKKQETARTAVVSVRTAGRGSFWRAGMQFTSEPKVLYSDEVSEEQLAALRAEPALVVDAVTGE